MFNALKLEKELSRQGIPLFATDEPADIEGVNATTVLVRRVKQGVAEWYRLQLKEKIWKGLAEHSLDGWNIGTPPYGYAAERIPHPVPFKAAQGRTKARLVLDPVRAPVIGQMFTWRVVDKLGIPTIAARLNANPAQYPPPNPATGWTPQNIATMLANPKCTGYMVYGRHHNRNGHRIPAPQDQWLWSPEPVHPAIIHRDTWQLAQGIGAEHSTSRDGDDPNTHPATARFYPYRGRVRCRDCQRRMAGTPTASPRRCRRTTGARTTGPTPSTPPITPTTPAASRPPKPASTRSSASSSLPASSAPTAPPCSPPSSPPPTPRPSPTATPRRAPSGPGSPGSKPRRTPRSSNWNNCPPTPTTPPPRHTAPASAPGLPNSTTNANR